MNNNLMPNLDLEANQKFLLKQSQLTEAFLEIYDGRSTEELSSLICKYKEAKNSYYRLQKFLEYEKEYKECDEACIPLIEEFLPEYIFAVKSYRNYLVKNRLEHDEYEVYLESIKEDLEFIRELERYEDPGYQAFMKLKEMVNCYHHISYCYPLPKSQYEEEVLPILHKAESLIDRREKAHNLMLQIICGADKGATLKLL